MAYLFSYYCEGIVIFACIGALFGFFCHLPVGLDKGLSGVLSAAATTGIGGGTVAGCTVIGALIGAILGGLYGCYKRKH